MKSAWSRSDVAWPAVSCEVALARLPVRVELFPAGGGDVTVAWMSTWKRPPPSTKSPVLPGTGTPTAQWSSWPVTIGFPGGMVTVLAGVGVADTKVVLAGSRS